MNCMGNRLPIGWALTNLGEIGTWTSGGTPLRGKSQYYGGSIPWVKTGDLNDRLILSAEETISSEGLKNSSAKIFPIGTLLMAMYGATIGRLGILKISAATNQACAALLSEGLTTELIPFVFYYLLSERANFRTIGQGGAQPNISQTIIKAHPFPVAPLKEQFRIVSIIEDHFSRLDEAVKLLERVQRNLKRYRASVLKAAVEGRLVPTEAELARAEGRDYEPASALLERAFLDRHHSCEKNERGECKKPIAPEIEGLPALPEGWHWASPDQLASDEKYSLGIGPFGSNLKVSDYQEFGVPLVFVRNIRSGVFGGADTKFVTHNKAKELEPHIAKPGDILITKMGEPPGDACMYPREQPNCIITADCIKWRPNHVSACISFFVHAINSQLVREQIIGRTKGVAQKKISLARFKNIAIPLPPLEEQKRICAEIEQLESLTKQIEKLVEQNISRCNRLRQAILKHAFEGKLVEQDPSDESASVLLERIRAERAAAEAEKKPRIAKRKAGRKKVLA